MTCPLNERFKAFLSQLSKAESIDDLKLPAQASDAKRADFLIENRKVIVELKSLESDPAPKVHAELKRQERRAEYPLFYGRVEVHKILKHLPDGADIMDDLFNRICNSLRQGFRSANRQIGSTKSIFGCPDSFGLLVVLNESITILSPEILAQRVSQLLTQTDPDGTPHYRHVTSVWLLFENYTCRTRTPATLLPSIVINGPSADGQEGFAGILEELQYDWAAFNEAPLCRADVDQVSDSDFMCLANLNSKSTREGPRHELWRTEYRRNPYLRAFSDRDVLALGARLCGLMSPAFLGEDHRPSACDMPQFLRSFTHFLEEVRFRGLDLKQMPDWRDHLA